MPGTVEVFFDFLSPPSYLAWTRMPAIVARTGAIARWRPMFTIGLHELTGNRSPVSVPNKGRWVMQLMAEAYPAMFVQGRDLSDLAVLKEIIASAGLDADRYLQATATDEVKSLLKNNTQEAADRGAFGAPTFFVGDEMFFGQDRLEFVEEELTRP